MNNFLIVYAEFQVVHNKRCFQKAFPSNSVVVFVLNLVNSIAMIVPNHVSSVAMVFLNLENFVAAVAAEGHCLPESQFQNC